MNLRYPPQVRRDGTRTIALIMGILVAALLLCGLALLADCAIGASVIVNNAASTKVRIPDIDFRHRRTLEREAEATFGIAAPVARIGAQIHQESGWNVDAESVYAQGLAQFTPATAKWLPSVCPNVGAPDPWDMAWSLRAIVCYDAWLYARVRGATDCDRWAFTLSAYNGGLGWISRDQAMAYEARDDPARWFGHVEKYSSRKPAAKVENRGYPRRILLLLEPAYVNAGWPGKVACQ